MPASSAYWRIASARSFLHVQLHLVKSTGTAIVISFFRHLGGSAAQSIVLRALKSLETVSINDLLPALKQYIADSGMTTEEFRKRPVLNAQPASRLEVNSLQMLAGNNPQRRWHDPPGVHPPGPFSFRVA